MDNFFSYPFIFFKITYNISMKKIVKDLVAIIIGSSLMALGIVLFLLPNQLSTGGFSGITTVLYYLFDLKIGTMTLVLNIPLFVFAFIKLGRSFFSKAVFGTISFSVLLNVFEAIFKDMHILTEDKLLSSIYGGLVVRNTELP